MLALLPLIGHLVVVRVMLLILLVFSPFRAMAEPPTGHAKVVVAHDRTGQAASDSNRAQALVDRALCRLTGHTDATLAWGEFVRSNDVVGIKVATVAAPLHASHATVVEAIRHGLRRAGVADNRIVVFDRDPKLLIAAGFTDATAIVGGDGWDETVFYENKLVGKLIWGDLLFGVRGKEIDTRSHLPKLLTSRVTKLINVPVLQDHEDCGLSGCLYNLSLGLVDNARRFELFGRRGNPAMAEINALPAVREKTVLHIMDALTAGYAGGPSFKPRYAWNPGRLYVSTDPVAIDTLCLELIEGKRRAAQIPAIGDRASHIAQAAQLGLGVADRQQIELIEVNSETESPGVTGPTDQP